MKLKFKKKHKGVSLPEYKTSGAAGMDVCADLIGEDINGINSKIIESGEIVKIDTGLYPEIPEGYELQVRSRSGLTLKQGLIVANAPGTIDSDFRGELAVILKNDSKISQAIVHGQRIAQIVLSKVEQAEIEEIDELTETDRGEQGYGSTGK